MSLLTGNVSNMSTAPEPKPHAQGRAISNTFFVFSHLLIPYLKMIVRALIVIFIRNAFLIKSCITTGSVTF